MSYYMNTIGCHFKLKKENIQKAWDALIEAVKDNEFDFVDRKELLNANTFTEAMSVARWSVHETETGDIDEIWFEYGEYNDNEIILKIIAPYVEKGCYVIMQGEDGDKWKWKFVDGEVIEINGHWVWDDEVGY